MNFSAQILRHSLDSWLAEPEISDVAAAQNISIEERLGPSRAAFFESFADLDAPSARALRRRIIDYYETYVRTAAGIIPHTFLDLNTDASAGARGPEVRLVRLECLDEVFDYLDPDITVESLSAAASQTDDASKRIVASFLEAWEANVSIPKNPCAFAAVRDEVWEEVEDDDWANRLRDRLGLGHYDPARRGGPIRVALFEYTVGDVLQDWIGRVAPKQAFCAPTIMDLKPSPWFFPTPRELGFGCPMALSPAGSDEDLIAELLHPRLSYPARRLVKVGWITAPAVAADLKAVRNAHLWALRIAVDRVDFGLEL